MQDCRARWSLFPAAFVVFVLAWAALCSPWLGGEVTIPYDAKAHFQAQLQFLANALHTGQSPFWAPNVFAGSPQIADPQSLIFSPAILIAYLSPEPSFLMVDAYVLGMLGCGGLAVLALFRDRGWHPIGAIVAALALTFGASAAWRIQHIGQIQSYALFPIALWLLTRTMERSSAAWGMAAGLCIGVMIVEPNQIALLAGYILAGFAVAAIWQHEAPRFAVRRLAGPLTAATGTALLVASVPVVLAYLFVEESNRPTIAFAEAARGSLHPASLLTAVVGDLYGALDPAVQYWGPYSMDWDPSNLALSQNMSQLYVGILPTALLLTIGLIRGLAWDREIRPYTIALVAMLIYALGGYTPIFYALYHLLPGVDLFRRPADATFLVGGLLAIVGGYLVHRLVERTVPAATAGQRILEIGLFPAILAAAVAIAVRHGHGSDAVKPVMVAAACVTAACIALSAIRRYGCVHMLGCLSAVTAATAGDLAMNNGPNESTALSVARYDFLKRDCKNETVRFLKARLKQPLPTSRRDRVELVGLGFAWPNLGLIHGFDHDLGYNPLRLDGIAKAVGAGDTIAGWDQRHFTPLFPSYRSLLADMLGLRYIATPVPIERIDGKLKPGDLIQIGRTKEAFIYENPRALPRVMFVPNWKLADFDALTRTGAWPAFDPTSTVLLEGEPPASANASTPVDDAAPGRAVIAHYENTVVQINVTASRSGFVLLNSAWHPWWRATVDGRPVEVLKANVLFRAVQVPAGTHSVRFEFEPIVGALQEIAAPLSKARFAARRRVQSRTVPRAGPGS